MPNDTNHPMPRETLTTNPWSLPGYGDDYADQLDSIDAEGCVPVPQGPGLGITYDWQAIEAQAVEQRVIT